MKYEMKVVIYNPETKKGMTSDIFMKLDCCFAHDPDQYGNGYFLSIVGGRGFETCLDIRYDYEFNPDNKPAYLEKWARNYWSGKDGAYAVKSLEISKAE